MRKVLREVKTKQIRPLWQVGLIFLISVVLINNLITLCNGLGRRYASIASFIILLISIGGFSLIIVKLLKSYTYTLDNEELIFQKGLGARSNIILKLNLKELEFIKPIKNVKPNKKVKHTYKFVCDKERDKFYVGQFNRDGKEIRFVFKPSKEMLKSIDTITKKETVQAE